LDAWLAIHIVAAFLGMLGGLARELMASETNSYYMARSLILGAICGLVFKLSGFPNHAGMFFAGYTSTHFLGKLKQKYDNISVDEEQAQQP